MDCETFKRVLMLWYKLFSTVYSKGQFTYLSHPNIAIKVWQSIVHPEPCMHVKSLIFFNITDY